jgi:hypothetical protein
MRALSFRPFCSFDGRQAGLLYLAAGWRDTTLYGIGEKNDRETVGGRWVYEEANQAEPESATLI